MCVSSLAPPLELVCFRGCSRQLGAIDNSFSFGSLRRVVWQQRRRVRIFLSRVVCMYACAAKKQSSRLRVHVRACRERALTLFSRHGETRGECECVVGIFDLPRKRTDRSVHDFSYIHIPPLVTHHYKKKQASLYTALVLPLAYGNGHRKTTNQHTKRKRHNTCGKATGEGKGEGCSSSHKSQNHTTVQTFRNKPCDKKGCPPPPHHHWRTNSHQHTKT